MASFNQGLSALAQHGFSRPFFQNLGITNVDEFVETINNKLVALKNEGGYKPSKNAIAYSSAVIIKELIVKKLNEKRKEILSGPGSELKKKAAAKAIAERASAIESVVPTSESVPESPVYDYSKKAKYSQYLNDIFNVSYDDWRDILTSEVRSNQTQCIRALNMTRDGTGELMIASDLNPLQQECTEEDQRKCKDCYICGEIMKSDQPTMNCEHVLPVTSALIHWWLMKGKRSDYTPEELEELSAEYDWAHECCNELKNNFDFIKFNSKTATYILNDDVINKLFNAINTSDRPDCPSVRDQIGKITPQYVNRRVIFLQGRLKNIINTINNNIRQFPEVEFYKAFAKFKLISAITDDNFLRAILGDGTTVKAAIIKETPLQRDARRDAEDKAEDEKRLAMQIIQKRARYEARYGPVQPANELPRSVSRVGKRKAKEAEIAASGASDDEVIKKFKELDDAEPKLDDTEPELEGEMITADEDEIIDYWELNKPKSSVGGRAATIQPQSATPFSDLILPVRKEFTEPYLSNVVDKSRPDAQEIGPETQEEPGVESMDDGDVEEVIKFVIDTVSLDAKLNEFQITIDINEVIQTFDELFGQPTDVDKLDISLIEEPLTALVPLLGGSVKKGTKTIKSRTRKTSKRMKRTKNKRVPQKSNKKRTRRHRKK
jgi:hypothetical protein